MHQIRYTYLFSPFVFSFSKVLSFDDLTIAPVMVNVNKKYSIKLCKKHKNKLFCERKHKRDENKNGKSA